MGVVTGDALGLPVQFEDREERKKEPVMRMIGYRTFNMAPGTWSDDSSLTLAALDSIRERKGIDYDDIMTRFVGWLEDGEYTPYGFSFDIGGACLESITNYEKNRNYKSCGKTGERANGNGALMRIMPVCLYSYMQYKDGKITIKQALENVHQVSALTHNHLRSKMACGIYFFLTQSILDREGSLQERLQHGMNAAKDYYKADIRNLTEWVRYVRIENLDDFSKIPENEINSSGYVVDSLEAAVWALITTDSLEQALLKAVNLGGDTDSISAIAGGLAGLYYGYESIPEKWQETIVMRDEILALCDMMEEKD